VSALEAKVEVLEGQLERCRSSMQQLEKSEAMILLGLQAIN
jgi:primosomal protein N''